MGAGPAAATGESRNGCWPGCSASHRPGCWQLAGHSAGLAAAAWARRNHWVSPRQRPAPGRLR
eukprot:885450-Alexandrium_andersonii.AAC.1